MPGKYTVFWELIKKHRTLTLECDYDAVKTIKKLISREKEKDLGWALTASEENNDAWLLKSSTEQAGEGKVKLTLVLRRRPLSI